MFKLSRKMEYALMALTFLHKEKKIYSVRDISDELSVPFDTVSKVLQLLNAKGIVGAEKGINGGYFLKKDFKNINLHDFFQLIEPKHILRVCEDGCDLMKQCNITGAINSLNILVKDFLKQISLLELLEGKNQHRLHHYLMQSPQGKFHE
jgi:Rrf2 family iron-sulfur cluster assembly transcriptional regulator